MRGVRRNNTDTEERDKMIFHLEERREATSDLSFRICRLHLRRAAPHPLSLFSLCSCEKIESSLATTSDELETAAGARPRRCFGFFFWFLMKGRMMDTVSCNCFRGAHTCLNHLGKNTCAYFLLFLQKHPISSSRSVCSMLQISLATCTLSKGCSIRCATFNNRRQKRH